MEQFSTERWRQSIYAADDFHALRKLRDGLHELLQSSVPFQKLTTSRQVAIINKIHDMLIQRTVVLSEAILQKQGLGSPPADYDFVLFGSGGRSEQTLWSDQDNGIIIDSLDAAEDSALIEVYFSKLAETISTGLELTGYPPCEGDVVCTNVKWRQPLDQWLASMKRWFAEPSWEHIRYLLVTVDARAVYGKGHNIQHYKESLFACIRQQPAILNNMLRNTLRHKVLLGLFGQFIKEQFGEKSGGIDIKYGAYLPMVNVVRLLAAEEGIGESSTTVRITQLQERGVITAVMAEEWLQAFYHVLQLRMKASFKLEDGRYSSNGILKVAPLSKQAVQQVKGSLRTARAMQRYIEKKIGFVQ